MKKGGKDTTERKRLPLLVEQKKGFCFRRRDKKRIGGLGKEKTARTVQLIENTRGDEVLEGKGNTGGEGRKRKERKQTRKRSDCEPDRKEKQEEGSSTIRNGASLCNYTLNCSGGKRRKKGGKRRDGEADRRSSGRGGETRKERRREKWTICINKQEKKRSDIEFQGEGKGVAIEGEKNNTSRRVPGFLFWAVELVFKRKGRPIIRRTPGGGERGEGVDNYCKGFSIRSTTSKANIGGNRASGKEETSSKGRGMTHRLERSKEKKKKIRLEGGKKNG